MPVRQSSGPPPAPAASMPNPDLPFAAAHPLGGLAAIARSHGNVSACSSMQVGKLIFSGIAGGIDPSNEIGDVVIPKTW